MNYNINEIEQVRRILHKQVKNKAILPWIDHILEELKERVRIQGDLSYWNVSKDMLRGANNWLHYINSACADVVSTCDFLMRHFQNKKIVAQLWDRICNGEFDNDFAAKVAVKDLEKAAQLVKDTLHLILYVKKLNKESN